MGANGLLIGYDAREDWVRFETAWDADRRRRFLLRDDVTEVRSVDSMVWPSVFDLVPGLDRPDWTGFVQDLWEDLGALSAAVRSPPAPVGKRFWFIAVELAAAHCSRAALADWRQRVPRVAPPDLDSLTRELLGYDVADGFLLSGLTNCEVCARPDPSRWKPLLNERHLFEDQGAALEFKTEVEGLVPEHAPFFVFALWRIGSDEAIVHPSPGRSSGE